MNREEQIKKWILDTLSPEEAEKFENSDEHQLDKKIVETAKYFKLDDLNEEEAFEDLRRKLAKEAQKPERSLQIAAPLLKIAAAIVLFLGIGALFFIESKEKIHTGISEKRRLELPDKSQVTVNAGSELSYESNSWESKRDVYLNGEAFFKVEKGSTFSVITDQGVVTVLGTQFNVKQRKQFFEVICYEGLVSVEVNGKTNKLPAGKTFRIMEGNSTLGTTSIDRPLWLRNVSSFKSVPFSEALEEFERQYDVIFDTSSINTERIFTGGFIHNSLHEALKSITLPLDLKYTIEDSNHIILSPIEP